MYLVNKVIAIVRRYSLKVSCVKNDMEEEINTKKKDGSSTSVTERGVGRVKCVDRNSFVGNPSFRVRSN